MNYNKLIARSIVVNARGGLKLKSGLRNKASKALSKVGTYHKAVPMDEIADALKKAGIVMLQEDNTEWSGFITGKEGSTTIPLAPADSKVGEFYTPYDNSMLALQWYKMPSGKQYEINMYLS